MAYQWGFVALVLICTTLSGVALAELSGEQNETSLSVGISGTGPDTVSADLVLEEKIENLTAFVKKGVSYAKNNTKEDALAHFNDLTGEFVNGEQYLFAYDINGTTLALAYEPELIGTNRMNLTDSNGMEFFKAMTYIAGYGGGFIYYVYPNPAQNRSEQVKFTYVEPINDTWFVGSGFYLPHINAVIDKDAIAGLVSRVEQGAAFAESEGEEKSSAAFNDINGTWSKDNTYLFSYGFDGMTLAMPYQPERVGTNRMDKTDKYGCLIARLEIDTAKAGGGFVYVAYYNPASGKDELKFCYVLPVQGDRLVGSGIYTGSDLSVPDTTS
ncbi:MAG TPA: cache domain-containing protein [Methanospirillum sp.]|nr:cache domain-containing protein [Methanospirillum sp.]